MATDAGLIAAVYPEDGIYIQGLTRFAALVAAHEREACAKLAENWDFNVQGLVKVIRARGENK